jgi:hypothetical protein
MFSIYLIYIKAINYFTILYYLKTSKEGIAHFISYLDPLLKEGSI